MVSINYASKEICCKIVFYGPGLSGKTTNLQYVHEKIPPQTRGELISLATDQDRTLYFDFLPVDIGEIHGFSIKFQLYTVPGQVYYNATRKLVLRGVDGLVFVADSQRSKMDENIESYQNLVENLEGYGYDVEKLPLVFQYNKRDLSDIFSVDGLESTLNPKRLPHFEAVAIQGIGVFDTLKCISKLVLDLTKGKKVVPEREDSGKEIIMAESRPAQPERVADLSAGSKFGEGLKTPSLVSLFPEKKEPLETREMATTQKEAHAHGSEEWSGSPRTGELTPSSEEPPSPQDKAEYESPPPEKGEESEKEKEGMVSGGLTHDGEKKKTESEASLPRAEESPTIISWSATRQKKKYEPKGFFLWRFFKKLLNR
jgi:signal recognition particle receptor subunit beta